MNKNTFGKYDFEAPIQYEKKETTPSPKQETDKESKPVQQVVKREVPIPEKAEITQPETTQEKPVAKKPETAPEKPPVKQQETTPEKQKEKGKSRLPVIAAVVFVALILALVAIMPLSRAAQEKAIQEKIEEAIHSGDEALKMGYYETAITYYESAGEAGAQKILEAKLQQLLQNAETGDYAAIRELAKEIDDATVLESLLPTLAEKTGNMEIQKVLKATDAEKKTYLAECESIHEFLQLLPKSNTQEYTDLTDTLYASMGYLKAWETAETKENDFTAARFHWEKCSEESYGKKFIAAIEHIEADRYLLGLDELYKLLDGDIIYRPILRYYLGERPTDSLVKSLEYDTCLRITKGTVNGTLSEAFANKSPINVGIHTFCDEHPLEAKDIKEIKDKVGIDPQGKVLILHRSDHYYSADKLYYLHTNLMRLLPDNRFPSNLEHVEYVILLDTTYHEDGVYRNGTIRIREYTTVQAFNARTGAQLYKSTANGPIAYTMYYSGKAPEYYTAGSPEINSLLIAACKKIEES